MTRLGSARRAPYHRHPFQLQDLMPCVPSLPPSTFPPFATTMPWPALRAAAPGVRGGQGERLWPRCARSGYRVARRCRWLRRGLPGGGRGSPRLARQRAHPVAGRLLRGERIRPRRAIAPGPGDPGRGTGRGAPRRRPGYSTQRLAQARLRHAPPGLRSCRAARLACAPAQPSWCARAEPDQPFRLRRRTQPSAHRAAAGEFPRPARPGFRPAQPGQFGGGADYPGRPHGLAAAGNHALRVDPAGRPERRRTGPEAGHEPGRAVDFTARGGRGRERRLRRHLDRRAAGADRHGQLRLRRRLSAYRASRDSGTGRGRRATLAGRVSMDMLAVDLSDLPEARVGDPVELWGAGLSVDEVAQPAAPLATSF